MSSEEEHVKVSKHDRLNMIVKREDEQIKQITVSSVIVDLKLEDSDGSNSNLLNASIDDIRSDDFKPQTSQGTVDIPRLSGHSAILFKSKMYLFGGQTSFNDFVNDLYCIDLDDSTFHLVPTQGEIPCQRIFHSCMLNAKDEKMYIFAGRTFDDIELNDLYELDLVSFEWKRLVCKGDIPKPREAHSCVYRPFSNSIFLFGGYVTQPNHDYHSDNSFYELDLNTLQWVMVNSQQMIPSRFYHNCVYLEKYDVMLVFGGRLADGTSTSDTYIYEFNSHTWQSIVDTSGYFPNICGGCCTLIGDDKVVAFGGEDDNEQYYNKLFVFDMYELKWKQLDFDAEITPRTDSSIVYCPVRRSLFIHGGFGESGTISTVSQFMLSIINTTYIDNIYNNLVLNEQFFDTIIKTGKEDIKAHSFILKQCKYFQNLHSKSDPPEISEILVKLPHMDLVLSFMYGREPKIDEICVIFELYITSKFIDYKLLSDWTIYHLDTLFKKKTKYDPEVLDVMEEFISRVADNELLRLCAKHVSKYLIDLQHVKMTDKVRVLVEEELNNTHVNSPDYISPSVIFLKFLTNRRQELKNQACIGDCEIKCPTGSQTCDKAILLSQCSYFRNVFTLPFKEKGSKVTEFDVLNMEMLDVVLDVAYGITSSLSLLDNHSIMNICAFANMICWAHLEQQATSELNSRVNAENALSILLLTGQLNTEAIQTLRNKCCTFLSKLSLMNAILELSLANAELQIELEQRIACSTESTNIESNKSQHKRKRETCNSSSKRKK